jgi:hypothetical protein
MNATMTAWERAVTLFAASVFSGSDEGNTLLTKFMAEGALIPGGVPKDTVGPKTLTADEMKELAKRSLFTYIIPEAWKNNKDANVAILQTENACGDYNLRDDNVSADDAKLVEFCFENKQYLLLAAIGRWQTCYQSPGSSFPYCEEHDWSLPPGLDKVGDFGISARDIMEA